MTNPVFNVLLLASSFGKCQVRNFNNEAAGRFRPTTGRVQRLRDILVTMRLDVIANLWPFSSANIRGMIQVTDRQVYMIHDAVAAIADAAPERPAIFMFIQHQLGETNVLLRVLFLCWRLRLNFDRIAQRVRKTLKHQRVVNFLDRVLSTAIKCDPEPSDYGEEANQ
jgi:hypothetical protein